MIAIGELDKQIIIQQSTITIDTMGGQIITWPLKTGDIFYAKVDWKEGKSSEDENNVQSIYNIEFTIRDYANSDAIPLNCRIGYPLKDGLTFASTQFFTINSVKCWGGREKWRTFSTTINANNSDIS